MLKLNLFRSLEKLGSITKTTIDQISNKIFASMAKDAETYIKLRIVADICTAVSDKIKAQLINEGFNEATYKSIVLSSKAGTSVKAFDDPELSNLEKEGKVLKAKIKARKTFLTETEQYTTTAGKPTIALKVSK